MKLPTLLIAAAWALLAATSVAAAPSAVVTTPQVRAELVAHAPEGVVPGKPLSLGLLIRHQPHWHTYWKNPGDSGLPTALEWTLPAGFVAGEIGWPTPKRLPIGPLMNYGYEGTLLLPVAVQVPAAFSASMLDVKLRADWLVCKEVCIPESGEFALSLPAQAATAMHASLFDEARNLAPRDVTVRRAAAAVDGDALVFEVAGLPAPWTGRALEVLPETAGVVANAAPQKAQWDGDRMTLRVPLDPQRTESPSAMHAVLIGGPESAGLRVQVAVTGSWPAVVVATAPAASALGTAPAGQVSPAAAPVGLPTALLFALAGGLLLNLMPCVFPVLSLKVLGFASHAHDRRQIVGGGMAYTAGVVLSFVALAALLLALRAGGEQLGWGFQLQNPWVVAGLAALFTLIGLNLAGVFEVGSVLPGGWLVARARHPMVDHLLTGVLAVAVASPCTAPFMGASLGLAMTLPSAQALLLFAALGLGMALPYLAICVWPALSAALPRPGAWMTHFKVLMAFPMFATVVWLVWVLGQQVGIDGAAALLALLVALAFLAWALGSPALGRRARVGFGVGAGATLLAASMWALPGLSTNPAQAAANGDGGWQPWSPAKVAEITARGQPVFVDFTAAWCVTCQFNKRTVLNRADVAAEFERRSVARLRADWTRRDPAITAELARLGRSGVPVYALYTPGAAAPRLLSEMPSAGEIRETLSSLP